MKDWCSSFFPLLNSGRRFEVRVRSWGSLVGLPPTVLIARYRRLETRHFLSFFGKYTLFSPLPSPSLSFFLHLRGSLSLFKADGNLGDTPLFSLRWTPLFGPRLPPPTGRFPHVMNRRPVLPTRVIFSPGEYRFLLGQTSCPSADKA